MYIQVYIFERYVFKAYLGGYVRDGSIIQSDETLRRDAPTFRRDRYTNRGGRRTSACCRAPSSDALVLPFKRRV